MKESIVTSEEAAKATNSIYVMTVLVSERARELKRQKHKPEYPYSEAIQEAAEGKLNVKNLLTRISKRK